MSVNYHLQATVAKTRITKTRILTLMWLKRKNCDQLECERVWSGWETDRRVLETLLLFTFRSSIFPTTSRLPSRLAFFWRNLGDLMNAKESKFEFDIQIGGNRAVKSRTTRLLEISTRSVVLSQFILNKRHYSCSYNNVHVAFTRNYCSVSCGAINGYKKLLKKKRLCSLLSGESH